MKWRAILCGVLLTVMTVGFASPAQAVVTGLLRTDTGMGTVVVSLSLIDWQPNTFTTGGGTNLLYAGGSVVTGENGQILDIPAVGGTPMANFMTFNPTDPAVAFDLNFLGPGSANTACAALAVGQSCSPFAGSPFILTLTPTGTGITLAVGGIARDGTTPSNWIGNFTTQIAGQTPGQIQAFFVANPTGSISSTASGEFIAQVVPEPATIAILGLGLLGVGMRARRRRQ